MQQVQELLARSRNTAVQSSSNAAPAISCPRPLYYQPCALQLAWLGSTQAGQSSQAQLAITSTAAGAAAAGIHCPRPAVVLAGSSHLSADATALPQFCTAFTDVALHVLDSEPLHAQTLHRRMGTYW